MKLLNDILLHYSVDESDVVMALIISTITVVVVLGTILAFLVNNTNQLAYAQTNNTTTDNMTVAESENITAPIAPQGTSLEVTNDTSTTENITETTTGNITTPVAPQGTSINASNATTTS